MKLLREVWQSADLAPSICPDSLVIYHGAHRDLSRIHIDRATMSWTTDWEVAATFAQRSGAGRIWPASIPRQGVRAALHMRGEWEIVADPDQLGQVEPNDDYVEW